KRPYYKLPTGALMPLEGRHFREVADALENLGIRADALQGNTMRLPLVRGLGLSEGEPGGAVRLGRTFRALLDDLRRPEYADAPLPAGLKAELRSYQRTGFQWMKTLARYRFGGILADEMGLGKTVQSIAFLLSVLGDIRESGQPALIVCPA